MRVTAPVLTAGDGAVLASTAVVVRAGQDRTAVQQDLDHLVVVGVGGQDERGDVLGECRLSLVHRLPALQHIQIASLTQNLYRMMQDVHLSTFFVTVYCDPIDLNEGEIKVINIQFPINESCVPHFSTLFNSVQYIFTKGPTGRNL